METYSVESTSLRDVENPIPNQKEEESTNPILDATIKDLITSTGPQEVLTSQRSDTQASSATAITLTSYIGTSSSKVSRTWEPYTFSAPQTSVTVPVAGYTLGHGLITGILILALIFIIIILMLCYLHRKRRRYSFDLFHKTAEDANIPLSSPVIPGAFEAIPDREDNKDVEQVNEDKVNHDKTSVVNLNLSEEINEKQNNCETETNHIPANLGQENMDNLDDWNFKPQDSTFTDIDLMDCAITE
ncbi:uncharacterized protein [Heptranchias perlo]